MGINTISKRMSSTTKKDDSKSKIKSYWYPERDAVLAEVREGYGAKSILGHLFAFGLVPVLAFLVYKYSIENESVQAMIQSLNESFSVLQQQDKGVFLPVIAVVGGVAFLLVSLTMYFMTRARQIYLIDFHVYQPPDKNKVTPEYYVSHSKEIGVSDESLEFQTKLLHRTGLGNETYFPDGIMSQPPDFSLEAARDEAHEVLCACFQQVLNAHGMQPNDVDILIVNCSLFNPTPSLSSMIVNEFKLKSSIKTINLSGMGCSAGIIAIDLARDLLQLRSAVAVVLSTENITQNWYLGKDRSMLVSNTLFRMGGAGVLLSSRWRHKSIAKYKLNTTVRVHHGADDASYHSIYQKSDEEGLVGVALSKSLLKVVGAALKSNMTTLGPQVLPWSEQLRFFVSLCKRKLSGKGAVYVPDFNRAFDHFCIHAGGRAVIDGLQENLGLSDYACEPSRATLYRFGNTSSSSVWYELNYIERDGRVKRGDRVWQIAIGAGVKCNSAVWTALRTLPGVVDAK